MSSDSKSTNGAYELDDERLDSVTGGEHLAVLRCPNCSSSWIHEVDANLTWFKVKLEGGFITCPNCGEAAKFDREFGCWSFGSSDV